MPLPLAGDAIKGPLIGPLKLRAEEAGLGSCCCRGAKGAAGLTKAGCGPDEKGGAASRKGALASSEGRCGAPLPTLPPPGEGSDRALAGEERPDRESAARPASVEKKGVGGGSAAVPLKKGPPSGV